MVMIVEPTMLVDVVAVPARAERGAERYEIKVGGVKLPVGYRSRSEALRIAEKAYLLLVDGYAERWSILMENAERRGC